MTGNYFKFEEGENNFRVLSDAITGFEYWTKDNKPIRSKNWPDSTPNIKPDQLVKHFWALVVWNCDEEKVQILEIAQKGIMNAITALINNKKWGDPKLYDLTVNRTGEGLDTEYTVTPNPKSDLPKKALDLYNASKIDLNALYEGKDPFMSETMTKDVKYPEGPSLESVPF
jgi:hypothetical protein